MNRMVERLFLSLTTLAVTSPAFAWGPQGHRVIAHVADDRLTPAAKAGVRALLHEGDTLADVANWADHEGHDAVPGSASWHYVNVPISAPRYEGRYCRRGDCVVAKIKQYRKILADHGAPRRERQRALLFLVHFVADIHQPLHVGDHDDRGGNLTQVQFLGRGTNLHRLWDSDLIHHLGGSDREWVERIERMVTPQKIEAWSWGTVEDWADESLRAAKLAYSDPQGSPAPLASGTRLGEDYVKFSDPILREQMARAGIRLANELNAIFR
jgi:hypothetical protein